MPTYVYKCPLCEHIYKEHRTSLESQYFTRCNMCGNADYEEVK